MCKKISASIVISLLCGCVNLKGYHAYHDPDGLFRGRMLKNWHPEFSAPEQVLRAKNGRLITAEDEASATLLSLGSLLALMDNAHDDDCSATEIYRAKSRQFQAETALRQKDSRAALESLDAAEKICPTIGYISAQDYDRALALRQNGDESGARAAAERFLKYSAAVHSAAYYQNEGPSIYDDREYFAHQGELMHKMRADAEAFVKAGNALPDWMDENEPAKFYPNKFNRPGGHRRRDLIALPTFAFGGVDGFMLGGGAYYSTGIYGFGAYTAYSHATQASYGLKLRDSIYESPKRDWNLEVELLGHTHKEVSYLRDYYDNYTDVHVRRTSFDPGVGAGATKRFWGPATGVSSELLVYADGLRHRADVIGSLYGFYDITRAFGFIAGYDMNRPMVGVSWFFFETGYDFKDNTVFLLTRGLVF